MRQTATVHATTTDALPVADRFPYWADVVAQTFVPLECDTSVRRDFSGSIRHRRIGRIGIADVRASAQRAQRTRAKIAGAPSDDLIVVVHMDGRCTVGQTENAALRPGDGAIVSAEKMYFFDFPEPFRQLVLKVPRALLRRTRTDDVDRAFRLAFGPANLLRHLALVTLDEPDALSGAEEVGTERAFAELLTSAIVPSAREGSLRDASSVRYASALAFIRRNYANPDLNPAAVAAHVGLSLRSVARLFARNETSIERSIWSYRLAGARDDLADPRLSSRSITDIAFSWGFNDAAHFSRSFVSAYGMSPKQFRAGNDDNE